MTLYNNLKIYCQCEDDQSSVFDFIFYEYQNEVKYCTWEPDGDDENPGSWGMFIDEFPLDLWDKLVLYLEGPDSWVLEDEVEMAFEDESLPHTEHKYYPPL